MWEENTETYVDKEVMAWAKEHVDVRVEDMKKRYK